MRRGIFAFVVCCASACTPSWVTLAPSERADAQVAIRTPRFEVTPPEGRWVSERIPAGADWGFDHSHWAPLLDGLIEAKEEGVRFCYVRRVVYRRGTRPANPKTDCYAIRAFRPIAEIASAPHSPLLLFAPSIETTRDQVSMEKSFWYGVESLSGHGRARSMRVAGRPFVRAEFVADYDDTRVLTGGGSALLGFVGDSLIVVWLPDAGLEGSSQRWRVVESLRPASR